MDCASTSSPEFIITNSISKVSKEVHCLGEAETIIQDYKVFGKRSPSPRTRHAFRESLFAFCGWCIWKKYLENNPFEEMSKYKPTPQTMRRAMTEEEIRALLAAAPIHRKMVYETAFMTGFRVGELRSLTIDHIDRVRNGIHLKAVDDKAGLARFQIVTEDFIQRLYEYGRTGDALTQYKISHARARKPMRKNIPENPLLYLPVQTSVMIYADLKKAGIPIKTMEGKVDFHACRTTFINMVIASGADIKTLQETARHERAETSLKYYARVNPINLQNTAKALAKAISSSENHVNCTKSALIQDDGEETKNAISYIRCMDDTKIHVPDFGAVLRKLRKERGLSQEQLSVRLGYNSSGYVSRLELGDKKPSVELLWLVAAALNVRPHEIIVAMEESEK